MAIKRDFDSQQDGINLSDVKKPVWKKERPPSLKGDNELRAHRIYPFGLTQRQALYNLAYTKSTSSLVTWACDPSGDNKLMELWTSFYEAYRSLDPGVCGVIYTDLLPSSNMSVHAKSGKTTSPAWTSSHSLTKPEEREREAVVYVDEFLSN
ncbi:hypothetical protein YC2023_093767 [Brassica napus]